MLHLFKTRVSPIWMCARKHERTKSSLPDRNRLDDMSSVCDTVMLKRGETHAPCQHAYLPIDCRCFIQGYVKHAVTCHCVCVCVCVSPWVYNSLGTPGLLSLMQVTTGVCSVYMSLCMLVC